MQTNDKLSLYCNAVASHFMINEKDFVDFTNQFWDIQINQPFDLTKMYQQIEQLSRSRASTPASSQPSTPRLGPSVAPDLLQPSAAQLTKITKKRLKPEDKPNFCIAVIKSGKKEWQKCGVACVDKYCATHNKVRENNVVQVTLAASLNKQTAEHFQNMKAASAMVSPTGAVTAIEMKSAEPKRKMLKKTPVELAKIDQKIIQSRLSAINVRKNQFGMYVIDGTDLLWNPHTQNVYGKQTPEGPIAELKQSDIEHCKELKLNCFHGDQLNDEDKMKVDGAGPDIQIEDPSLDYEDEEEEEEEDWVCFFV